jgi:hypothetical protein
MRGLGWQNSLRKRRPMDKNNTPTPWYTYAALEWLTPRVHLAETVFEFGAGFSTVWYGRQVRQVVAVDHVSGWLDQVRKLVGENVTLLLRDTSASDLAVENKSPYQSALDEYPPDSFDIIVVDGMERVKCACAAPSQLRHNGIIILDNSDRPSFRPAIDFLHEQKFARIDFYDFVAQAGIRTCTSVFSRSLAKWSTLNIPIVSQGY